MNKKITRDYTINVYEEIKKDILAATFDTDLDSAYWNVIEQGNDFDSGVQYFSSKNVGVRDGFFEIQVKSERHDDYNYTSGLVDTKSKFEFLYGKIIIKAKPAVGMGLLSAIMLRPADGSTYPQVDIMGAIGDKSINSWAGVRFSEDVSGFDSDVVSFSNSNDFSIYEVDWEEDRIAIYVNNKLVYENTALVPAQKMYLATSLTVSDVRFANPDGQGLLSKFLIDYVIIKSKVGDAQ